MNLGAKLAIGAVLALLLGGGLYYGLHAVYAAGESVTQVRWDQDKLAQQRDYDKRLADLAAQLARTQKANEALHEQFEAKSAQADADAAGWLKRLRDTAASLTAATGTLSKVGDIAGSAAAGRQDSTERLGQLLGLVADFHTECVKNDDRLDTIVAQGGPQT